MKKILTVLLLLLLCLTGCDGKNQQMNEPETVPTEPQVSWLEKYGTPWDREGMLVELPINIPDGLHYGSIVPFDGDLLFWGIDDHLADAYMVEFCVLDLDTGFVAAQIELALSEYTSPQILGDTIYITEPETGRIHALDKELNVLHIWHVDPVAGAWYMGDKQRLYVFQDYAELYLYDLITGMTYPVLEESPVVEYVTVEDNSLIIEYYGVSTGATCFAVLDLFSGQISYAPDSYRFSSVSYIDGDWLCGYYVDNYTYHLSLDGEKPVSITTDSATLQLQDGKYILKTPESGSTLTLYDLQGHAISHCFISEREYGLGYVELIWSERYDGYFLLVSDYSGTRRLLFWDITKRRADEPLPMEQIPDPSEQEQRISQRVDALSEKYGLIIMTGNDCDTEFDEFTATRVTDYQQINSALDMLDEALSVYPEGFFRQLRYGSSNSIQIQLIVDLQADGSGRYGGDYCAFTQSMRDYHLMVVDIEASTKETYYHEFSHIIDCYLQWDSENRENALFSEETWCSLNPRWFSGYSYDYSTEIYLDDFTYFVDSYSTISPTEDRARVLEYAMSDYGRWTFDEAAGLRKKLSYYCSCIRDAFDTTGWPESLPWEQYLP